MGKTLRMSWGLAAGALAAGCVMGDDSAFELPYGLEAGALFEWEVAHSDGGTDEAMATVELGAGWQAADWLRGDVTFLYEEDDTDPMEVDQLFVTLGGTEEIPFYLQGGQFYVPFGNLESFFISDPIVLELAESRERGATLGIDSGGFSASLTLFESDVRGADDYNGVLAASYSLEAEESSVAVGAAVIRNILDADSMTAGLEDAEYLSADEAAGFNAWLTATAGRATFIAEYVQTLEEIEVNGFDTGLKPASVNLELGYALTDFLDVAAKYEHSSDTAGEFAENRVGAVVGCTVFEHDLVSAGVAFEYMREEYEDSTSGDVFTMQIALEF